MGGIPIVGKLFGFLDGEGVDGGVFIAIGGIIIVLILFSFVDVSQFQVVTLLFALAPLWLPYLAFGVLYWKWMETVGNQFYLDNGRTTMEIKLPPEVFKSPEAMETVFNLIHNVASPDNLMQTYLDGKRPLPYSFELVSTGGQVHFYVNVPTKKTKESFKIDLYSQYPGVEIIELPLDYTAEVPSDLKGFELMGFRAGKKKASVYPLKLYQEFGMDKLPKEEEKLDPITPMLEALGSIKPHERLWIQFIITPHREQNFKNGQLRPVPTWDKEARAEIDKIMNRDSKTKRGLGQDEDGSGNMNPLLTPGERTMIEVMERNLQSYAYETGIRWLYIAEKGKFNPEAFAPIIRAFSQWDVQGRNAIGIRWRTDYNYKMFSDPLGSKIPTLKREELKYYKLRKYWGRTGADQPKIFTSAELATIYHLPGKVAMTPTLQRITSTRSEAPSNLPIGN
jgi:hypothetical protein